MLAQVKKLAGDDVVGRLGAWWNGRDYVAPAVDEAAAADGNAPAEKSAAAAPVSDKPVPEKPTEVKAAPPALVVQPEPEAPAASRNASGAEGDELRIRALETLWGEGRLGPGSFSLDSCIVDTALELADRPGDIGFIGADGALLNTFAAQSDRRALATEWRSGSIPRLGELAPKASVASGEVDRPRNFPDASLPAIISVEAFAYADHKAGLVGRVFRALDAGGRWIFLDTTRRTKKTPPQAFASAWAEPQLATNDEVEELLTLAGFKTVRRVCVNESILAAARQGYANLSQVLEKAATSGLAGREGALFLQELAWEAQSWRARTRALEGGALEVNLWVADKTEQTGPLEHFLDLLVQPDDAGAADALFDKT